MRSGQSRRGMVLPCRADLGAARAEGRGDEGAAHLASASRRGRSTDVRRPPLRPGTCVAARCPNPSWALFPIRHRMTGGHLVARRRSGPRPEPTNFVAQLGPTLTCRGSLCALETLRNGPPPMPAIKLFGFRPWPFREEYLPHHAPVAALPKYQVVEGHLEARTTPGPLPERSIPLQPCGSGPCP